MHALALSLLVLSAEPAPALKSLSGLNVATLKPWLMEQLPSLAQCALPTATEGDDVVSVQAQFSRAPEVSVTRVDAALSDVACVRGVVERWKRDAKQPTVGPFSFKYRFKPSAPQRVAVAAQARLAFAALCAAVPGKLSREVLQQAIQATKPPLPMGARVSLEDTMLEADSLEPAKVSGALVRALREAAASLKAEESCGR